MVQNYSKAIAGKLGAEKSKITSAQKLQERIKKYLENPCMCKHCQTVLDYSKRHKIFCTSSCSATHNNLKRGRRTTPKEWSCVNCGKEYSVYNWKIGKYCNIQCQQDYQYKERIKKWLEEGISWNLQIPAWAKKHLSDTRGYACEVCGISDWNSKTLSLECDHIDGHHANNHPSNLRLICPNCHSQTETYKAKNKGKEREKRRSVN